ncbi:hypothetical protein [Lentzea sp. NPDC004782]|uniref:hypothetical protein n=1 Tax=Lentzea sp. NPDC004782 TaxID=3154458 RepID=UPI0033A94989
MTSAGVLIAVVATGTAGFAGEVLPPEHPSAGPEAAVHRGDSFEAVVRAVSEVDSFDGVEPATGLFFRAHVAGLLSTGCRLTQSREAAQNLLLGKNVRLVVRKDGVFDGDRMTVDVVLPDGTDYARTVVHDGLAPADPSARGDLAVVDAAARREHRGLWAVSCATAAATSATAATTSNSSSSPVPATTTTATTTTDPVVPTSPSVPVTTSSPPPGDGSWIDVLLGRPCFEEGARRTSASGDEMVCERNGRNRLRWRRVH